MISTKGRYALRVMLDLAQQDPDHYTPLDEIATRQGISKKYLEIILKVLVREKLLKGLRGKGGGYRLTRTPQEYRRQNPRTDRRFPRHHRLPAGRRGNL